MRNPMLNKQLKQIIAKIQNKAKLWNLLTLAGEVNDELNLCGLWPGCRRKLLSPYLSVRLSLCVFCGSHAAVLLQWQHQWQQMVVVEEEVASSITSSRRVVVLVVVVIVVVVEEEVASSSRSS